LPDEVGSLLLCSEVNFFFRASALGLLLSPDPLFTKCVEEEFSEVRIAPVQAL
jgi:hypothetical protein